MIKRNILYNGKRYSLTEIVEGRNLTAWTLRSRLNRADQTEVVDGVVCFVCTDHDLRPQLKVGKRESQRNKYEDLPFQLTTYTYNVDGGNSVLMLCKKSQEWLRKPIRISR